VVYLEFREKTHTEVVLAHQNGIYYTMNVLIVNRYMGFYGGAETVVKELAQGLRKIGVGARVITLNISDEVRALMPDTQVVVPSRQMPYALRSVNLRASLGILDEMRLLRSLIKKHAPDFDVINVHNFPASWVAWGLKKPVVWMCNEIPDFYNNPSLSFPIRLLRKIGLACDKFIVNHSIDTICVADELNAQRVKSRYGRVSKIVAYGIDHENLAQNSMDISKIRKEFNISDNCFVLLQVGVLSPQKNQLESLKALKTLLDKKINTKLLLAGKGDFPYKNILNSYIRQNNLTDFVIFTGHLSRNETMGLYRIADLCLFPVKDQGGWLAPFEALSLEKPIVASPTMGASFLIKKHNFGIINSDFSSAVLEFIQDQDKWNNIASSASLWIKNNLTWKRFAEQMVEVFKYSISNSE
jgi:glycosyltransferase involved in cell wall biosynthesis